jgi:hypothetical protein
MTAGRFFAVLLILRSAPEERVSKEERVAVVRDARKSALLTMRQCLVAAGWRQLTAQQP